MWREGYGAPWRALYKDESQVLSSGDQVSLDCNDPEGAIFTCQDESAMQQGGGYQQDGGYQQGGYQQQGKGGAADDDRDCNRLVMILGSAPVVVLAYATFLTIKLCARQQPSNGNAKAAAPSVGQEPIKHGRRTEVELTGTRGAGSSGPELDTIELDHPHSMV